MMQLGILGLMAMAQPAGGDGQQANWMTSLLPLAVIFAIFYFLMIRPQQKQAKKVKEMLAELKKGDRVITRGGLMGTIHGIADGIITLELAENVRIKITREAVAGLQNAGAE